MLKSEVLDENIKHFIFETKGVINFKEGQYISLILKNENIRKPYSIVNSFNNENKIELCIKKIEGGNLTPILFDKEEREIDFEIMGPFGEMTIDKITQNKIFFIATGTGIAPLKSIIEKIIKDKSKEIILLFKCSMKILYEEEFENLQKENENFEFVKFGEGEHFEKYLEKQNLENSNFFICGLKKMVDNVNSCLIEKNVLEENIIQEKYD